MKRSMLQQIQHLLSLPSNSGQFAGSPYHLRSVYLQLLRGLVFRTHLLRTLDQRGGSLACRETKEDLHARESHLSDRIQVLLKTLKAAEQRATALGLGGIKFIIHSPTRHTSRYALKTCLHRKFVSLRVRLLTPGSLPVLMCLRSLHITKGEFAAGR